MIFKFGVLQKRCITVWKNVEFERRI